jgi:hypothetical protein
LVFEPGDTTPAAGGLPPPPPPPPHADNAAAVQMATAILCNFIFNLIEEIGDVATNLQSGNRIEFSQLTGSFGQLSCTRMLISIGISILLVSNLKILSHCHDGN